jgi:hypothetical protein
MARGGGGLEPLDTCQRWSTSRRRGGVRSLGDVVAPETSLSREAGSGTMVAHASVWMQTLPFVLA